MQFHENAMNIL